MRYLRCQCGACERWDSGEAVHPCEGCTKCGTTYATSPAGHQPVQPHDYEERYAPSPVTAPKIERVCRVCRRRERATERTP